MGTLTPNRGLTKPNNNGDIGLWGIMLDGDLSILDTILGGCLNTNGVVSNAINVAGAANVNLTTSQAQQMYLQFTGLLTGNIEVFYPTGLSGFFFLENSTTGAFSLTVGSLGGGVGVSLPTGAIVLVLLDAYNAYNVAAAATANPTLTVTASTTLNLTNSQQYAGFNRTAAISAQAVNLPSTPSDGENHVLQDLVGNFNAYPLTVTPPGGTTIAGLSSWVCDRDYGTYAFRYYATAAAWGLAQS